MAGWRPGDGSRRLPLVKPLEWVLDEEPDPLVGGVAVGTEGEPPSPRSTTVGDGSKEKGQRQR